MASGDGRASGCARRGPGDRWWRRSPLWLQLQADVYTAPRSSASSSRRERPTGGPARSRWGRDVLGVDEATPSCGRSTRSPSRPEARRRVRGHVRRVPVVVRDVARRHAPAGGLRRIVAAMRHRGEGVPWIVCLMIEGQEGVTWDQWVALARACEAFGYEGLFRSDHYLAFSRPTSVGRSTRGRRWPRSPRSPNASGSARWSPR